MGVYEDWRNKKLQELIDAGINPFIEIDIDNLPADGATYETYFPSRKIYGNIVDGIPGIKLKSDKTIHYDVDTDDALKTVQDVISANLIDIEEFELHRTVLDQGWSRTYASAGVLATGIGITNTNFPLVAGAAANQVLAAPGAGQRWACYWIEVSTGLAGAAGGQNYHVTITEETSGDVYADLWIHSFNMPYKFTICNDSGGTPAGHATADDQDLLITIDGGNGAENIWVRTCWGLWT